MDYIKQHRIHILFEKLAATLLAQQPDKPISFLIEQLQQLQGDEGAILAAPTHNPQAVAVVPPAVKPKLTMAVFGLGGAGKTTLITAISGEVPNPDDATPTVGFSPYHFNNEQLDLTVFDLGGAKKIRGIWNQYYSDVHGIIYVVDSAAQETFEEAKQALADILQDERAKNKPLLVFANKQDKSTASTATEVERVLGIRDYPTHHVYGCSAIADPVDENIDTGLQWVLDRIRDQLPSLEERVKRQKAEDDAARRQRFEEQKRRVEQNKKEEEAEKAAAAAGK